MDCRQAQSSLADLSAEYLPPASVVELHSHLEHCPECRDEWEVFQATLRTLSTSVQALPTQQQTQAMWNACLHKWTDQVEQQRTSAQRVMERQTAPVARPSVARPTFWTWMRHQPRWGWAALGGAMAVFGSSWMLSPHEDALEPMPNPPILVKGFDRPPVNTASLVNHHSAMAFDPFTDHVGATLVSYSATAPSPLAPAP